jgi:hypothetical protein
MLAEASKIAKGTATLMGTSPEAIGLWHFLGCCLSRSASAESLRIYTHPLSTQNRKKAASTLRNEPSGCGISIVKM